MRPRTMKVRVNGKEYTRAMTDFESLTTWLNERFPGQKLEVSTSYRPGFWCRVYTVYTRRKAC